MCLHIFFRLNKPIFFIKNRFLGEILFFRRNNRVLQTKSRFFSAKFD